MACFNHVPFLHVYIWHSLAKHVLFLFKLCSDMPFSVYLTYELVVGLELDPSAHTVSSRWLLLLLDLIAYCYCYYYFF